MTCPMWLWSSGQDCCEYAVVWFRDVVSGGPSPACGLIWPRDISFFETTFIPHATVVGWCLYSSRFLVNIAISADFSLEISSLCSVYHSSMVWSVFCSVLRMVAVEGPCIIIIMSSAYTTILTFGLVESSAIRSLMIMFRKVWPETDPCGQPLMARLELPELPNITWAVRSLKK